MGRGQAIEPTLMFFMIFNEFLYTNVDYLNKQTLQFFVN